MENGAYEYKQADQPGYLISPSKHPTGEHDCHHPEHNGRRYGVQRAPVYGKAMKNGP